MSRSTSAIWTASKVSSKPSSRLRSCRSGDLLRGPSGTTNIRVITKARTGTPSPAVPRTSAPSKPASRRTSPSPVSSQRHRAEPRLRLPPEHRHPAVRGARHGRGDPDHGVRAGCCPRRRLHAHERRVSSCPSWASSNAGCSGVGKSRRSPMTWCSRRSSPASKPSAGDRISRTSSCSLRTSSTPSLRRSPSSTSSRPNSSSDPQPPTASTSPAHPDRGADRSA